MSSKKRRIMGVVAASAADIEQREILSGIIQKAQSLNIDIAVFSNIYNPIETADVLKTENRIYDLMLSEELDGIILISEAIVNTDLQQQIKEQLSRVKCPIIVTGTPLPDFVLPEFHFINTSDENDIEAICDHLIHAHGFTDIHILSGHDSVESSHKRVDGYKRSLRNHGIDFDEGKVFFGDFWLNSGRAQAKSYISGELPYPQALICCNDYMAYGLLDEFMLQQIDITQKMAVVGYEYIRERRNHTPLLTTYQRNRKELGAAAVSMLDCKLKSGAYPEFTPPMGRLIHGDTCSCGAREDDIRNEILAVQVKATYDFLNLFSQLEHRLTECRNIDEFVARCWDFQFMIRGVDKLYMCLYENWYDTAENSRNMVCYNLLTYEEPLIFSKNDFSALFREDAAPYYFCPLFFSDRELGYVVLRFSGPDTFDHIFRNWLKAVANGLEFLRMKNDIQYLTQCQNLSDQRDTLTGMRSEKGLKKLFRAADKDGLYLVMLRSCLFSGRAYGANHSEKISAVLDAAEAVRQFCGNNDVCARTDDNTFLCLVKGMGSAETLTEQLSALLIHHEEYMREYGMDSFVCAAVPCGDMTFRKAVDDCLSAADEQMNTISQRRLDPHYRELNKLRSHIYSEPIDTFESDKVYALFKGSPGYLRTIYRKCYGFTLHDDCTRARVAFVRCLLTQSTMTIAEIAEKCGYRDGKYLMQQFRQETGYTAVQYRNIMK